MPDRGSSARVSSLRWGKPVGLTLGILLLVGVGHRVLLARIDEAMEHSIMPLRPLTTLPLQLGSWEGVDLAMDANVLRVAGDDAYLNRAYAHERTGRSITLYVGYIGKARSVLGHRPDICYATHGYEEISRTKVTVASEGGAEIPGLLYAFRSPELGGPRVWVLANYLLNGRFVDDTDLLSDFNARGLDLFGRQTAYVARIQVALSASGDADEDLAILSAFTGRIVEPIAAMMPGGSAVSGTGRQAGATAPVSPGAGGDESRG